MTYNFRGTNEESTSVSNFQRSKRKLIACQNSMVVTFDKKIELWALVPVSLTHKVSLGSYPKRAHRSVKRLATQKKKEKSVKGLTKKY